MANLVGMNSCDLRGGISNPFASLTESPEEHQARLAREREREQRVQWYMSQGMGRKDAESETAVDYGELDPALSRRNLKNAALGAAGLAATAGGIYLANKYVMPVVDKKNKELQAKYLR